MAVNVGRSLAEGLAIGRKLLDAQEYRKAVQCHRLIALRFPLEASAYMALGQSFRSDGSLEKTRRAFRRAAVLKPGSFEVYFNHGNAERSFDQPSPALKLYQWATCLRPGLPELDVALALAQLQAGDWLSAWPRYEARDSRRLFEEELLAHGQKAWDGARTPGHRLLIVSEQGAGDAIQFVRYGQYLAEAGMEVNVHCQKHLARLFAAVPWINGVSTAAQPEVDSNVMVMSLPHRFATTPDSIPADVPYLRVPDTAATAADPDAAENVAGVKVGLVWSGSPQNPRNELRSCPREAFTHLLDVDGAAFQSLQLGWPGAPEDASWSKVAPLGDGIEDFADTAAVIDGLDLVIAVDTSVAHLAGALGKPVWLLLGRFTDWRWLLGREDTPWYPTMRVLRMGDGEDWDGFLKRVAMDLRDHVSGNTKTGAS